MKLGAHPRIREMEFARLRLDVESGQAPNGEPFDEMFVFSTERLASDGGVIYVDAWRTEQYMTNPRFIANHDMSGYKSASLIEQAAGQTVWVGKRNDLPVDLTMNGRGLVGAVRFAKTNFGKDLRLLYAEGDMRAVSVRWDWQTEEARNPFEEEVNTYGDSLYWVVTRADLLEVSAVILGADPGALAIRGRDELGVPQFSMPSEIRLRPEFGVAMARCRQRGHDMTALERLRKQIEPTLPIQISSTEGRNLIDSTALSDALAGFDEAMGAFESIVDGMPTVRDMFQASRAELEALTVAEPMTDDGDDEDDERSAEVLSLRELSETTDGHARELEALEESTVSVIEQIRQSAEEIRQSGQEVRAAAEQVAERLEEQGEDPPAPADASAESEGAGAADDVESTQDETGESESEDLTTEPADEIEEIEPAEQDEGEDPEDDAVDLGSVFAQEAAA